MPQVMRDRIEVCRYEMQLIDIWFKSPHLLDIIGVVLGRTQDLPTHLALAP